ARAFYLGAIVWSRVGEPARGLEWASRALAMDPEEPVTLYAVACVYALQGQTEKALDCLESAVKHGYTHKEWIEQDSDFTSLRGRDRRARGAPRRRRCVPSPWRRRGRRHRRAA